jgi:predicted transcriptional regulator
MIVRTWMSTRFVLLPVETSLPDALRFLNTKGINLVGVLRHGHMAGAVSRSEIYEMLESGDPMTLLSRKSLASVVPPTATTVFADESLDRAARLIVERGLPALPVMDKDDMVGVLTPTDVCRAVSVMMGSRGLEAPVVMTMTTSRESRLLDEIERRSRGHSIVSVVAYPSSAQEMHVTLRMKADSPVAIERVA